MATPLSTNPLPPCPDTPNCVRVSQHFAVPVDTLFRQVQDALDALGPSTVDTVPEEPYRLDAVFKVFLFKDDVALYVEPSEQGAAVHIRSASRTGHSDLGVNQRRVNRFFRALEERL